jgi:hypothetical protein
VAATGVGFGPVFARQDLWGSFAAVVDGNGAVPERFRAGSDVESWPGSCRSAPEPAGHGS